MTELGVRVVRSGDDVRVELSGELDMATAERARAAVEGALEPPPATLTVALTGVTFIDSHGIWLLVECHRQALRGGFRLHVEAAARGVLRALEIAGLHELVTEPLGPAGDGPVRLALYVSGDMGRSARAVAAARALVQRLEPGAAELEVIDVLADPRRAEEARIIATPTLVRRSPPPPAKLIGELDGVDMLAERLGLDALLDRT